MDDLPLGELDAFTAVARARSFRGAARRRGVSASSLSAALRRLEQRLGVRLLNRTTRSVTPTEAGLRLLDRLAPALGEIAVALDQVESSRRFSPVRGWSPISSRAGKSRTAKIRTNAAELTSRRGPRTSGLCLSSESPRTPAIAAAVIRRASRAPRYASAATTASAASTEVHSA